LKSSEISIEPSLRTFAVYLAMIFGYKVSVVKSIIAVIFLFPNIIEGESWPGSPLQRWGFGASGVDTNGCLAVGQKNSPALALGVEVRIGISRRKNG
jgi:hypothetical protein